MLGNTVLRFSIGGCALVLNTGLGQVHIKGSIEILATPINSKGFDAAASCKLGVCPVVLKRSKGIVLLLQEVDSCVVGIVINKCGIVFCSPSGENQGLGKVRVNQI